jgi:hypothetical protein
VPYNVYVQQLWNAQLISNQASMNMIKSLPTSGIGTIPNYQTPFVSPPIATNPIYNPGYRYPYNSMPGYGSGYGMSPDSYLPYYGYGYGNYDMYGYASFGQALRGAADYQRSTGSYLNAYEQARLMREQSNQAKIETKKRQFELDLYIKQHTPTYTEEQAKNAKLTLQRIQTNSLPGEVTSGKALNYLLDDLRKYPGKKTSVEPLPLSEGMLTQLNITKKNHGLGILRDDGRFSWPAALYEMLTIEKRKGVEARVQELLKQAQKDRPDPIELTQLRNEMEKIKDDLVKKVNDVPTGQYLDAKRFLNEFYDATVAMENGEAQTQAKFQRFIEGGKSIQEVADYMVQHGLRFAPASANDEAAYRAVHSALAAYSVALNAQIGYASKE